MVKLSRLIMIFDWRRQGLSISAIAHKTGLCRKTIRQHLKRGLEHPVYGPRHPRPRLLDPYEGYLRERVESCPGLSGKRLFREIRELGYEGGYTAVTDCLREIRPVLPGQLRYLLTCVACSSCLKLVRQNQFEQGTPHFSTLFRHYFQA